MSNKNLSSSSATFFLLFFICLAVVIGYSISFSNNYGEDISFSFDSIKSILSIVYLAAILLVMIFMYAKVFPAVILFSLVAGGIMLYSGIQVINAYSDVKSLLTSNYIESFDIIKKANSILVALMVYIIGNAISFIFMGLSIILNTKKQAATLLSLLTLLVSIITVVPILYYLIQYVIDIFKLSSVFDSTVLDDKTMADSLTFLKVTFICIILSIFFCALGTGIGAYCFKFKARRRNNYIPYAEEIDNPYATPRTSSTGSYSASDDGMFGTGGTMGGNKFYQPYSNDKPETSTLYQPYGSSTAAESVLNEKAEDTYNKSNAFVNEVTFTATKDDYIEHEFGTPDSIEVQNNNLSSISENQSDESIIPTLESTPVINPTPSRIIIDDGARFDDGSKDSNSGFSVADEIQKFRNLADNGIISEVEFEEKKRQLLNN